jgi:hypothetical protein
MGRETKRRFPKEKGNLGRACSAILCGAAIAIASAASAAEPRPWLCRDKPSFSSDKPMTYEESGSGGQRWRIVLMQFEPGAAHDGYEVVASNELAAPGLGRLEPGRYFAVAMHLAEGHWICHASSRSPGPDAPGTVRSLCFSTEESGACSAKLTVKEAGSSAAGLR